MENGIVGIAAGRTRKPDHIAMFIDRHGRDPMVGANVADVDYLALFPERCVTGGMSSHCLVTNARDADDLASIIDSRSGAGSVAGEQGEFFNLVSSRSPDDSPELEDLRGHAGRVANSIFRPPHYLTTVVGASGEAIISPQRW